IFSSQACLIPYLANFASIDQISCIYIFIKVKGITDGIVANRNETAVFVRLRKLLPPLPFSERTFNSGLYAVVVPNRAFVISLKNIKCTARGPIVKLSLSLGRYLFMVCVEEMLIIIIEVISEIF